MKQEEKPVVSKPKVEPKQETINRGVQGKTEPSSFSRNRDIR